MKPSRRFLVLMPTIAVLALAITLPTTESAQASLPGQSAEELIMATLDDASESLGGGFVLDPGSSFYTARPPKEVGINDADYPVTLTEFLAIRAGILTFCESIDWQPYTFHGMQGCILTNNGWGYGGHISELWWSPQSGLDFYGNSIVLGVGSILGYSCREDNDEESNTRASCDSINALPLAEALHQAAIENGLYEPMPEETLPVEPGEILPGQPEVPTDQTVPTEPGGLFEIPLPVFLGSLAIPMAGAFTGAVLSALWSSLSSAGAAKVGESLAVGADKLILDPVEASIRLAGLGVSLDEINQELLARNIYVTNPLQKVPFLVFDGLSKAGNWVWDHTAGWVTNSNGLTCDGYVDETVGKVIRVVREQYGADAKIENILFEEKTTHNPQGVLDSIDSLNKDNHNLVKVTLPDGSEWAVDFHQHNTGSQPPILRPWNEAQKVWEDYMGDEFSVRTKSVYE